MRRFEMRTVAELIDVLRRHPPDRHVLVDGYESGFDTWITRVENVVVGQSDAWYEGRWQSPSAWQIKEGADPATEEKVLILGRTAPVEIGESEQS